MLKSVSPQVSPASSGSGSYVRIVLTPEQANVLEAQFSRVKNPHHTDLMLLAAETGLDEQDVQVRNLSISRLPLTGVTLRRTLDAMRLDVGSDKYFPDGKLKL